jgi:phage host-nuclease inhibitor protein Gam
MTDTYADLDAYVVADLPDFDDQQEPPTAIDLPDIERRLRRIRVLTDTLGELEQVAKDDKARIDAWLEERSAIVRREVEWWTTSVERWHRAHVREGGAKTVSLPSGSLSLRQGQQRVEPLTKEPSELVPDDLVRVKREWDKQAVKAATAPGPVAEGVQAPEGYVAHWAVDANGERVPDVVRLVPIADTFSVRVAGGGF